MKERKNLRNLVVALAFFVLWGNVVSLMLPADLAAWLSGRLKAKTASSRGGKKAEEIETDAAE